ncbi:MAG: NADH-quinone oxidoreductase subunit L [Candidatus Omnitrophota bacterium]
MNNGVLAFSIIFIPLIGALLLPLAGRISRGLRNALALVFVASSFVLSLKLIPFVMSGHTLAINKPLLMGLNFTLNVDSLAVFMAATSSLIGAIIILYSFGYISHYENQNEYYLMVVLFLGSMMGIIFSANLIFLYMFWEMTAIASWRLIGFFRKDSDWMRADKAFLVTMFGAVMMLVGFIYIYSKTGSFDIPVIRGILSARPLPDMAVLLILFGIFTKSATLPFHTWLPDAGIAPSPVTALLHAAVLVKIGVYVFARLFVVSFEMSQAWYTAVPLIAGLSAVISAGAALVEVDIKRIVAYSTISQIGFIFFGLSTSHKIGVTGGLLYILMHGMAKAGLFLSAGIIEQNAKTKDITRMGGLIKTMPLTALSFLFCAFSVMAIPPFGGFFSKYLVFMGAIEDGSFVLTFLFLLGAILTILYLLRMFKFIFLGDLKIEAREGSRIMVASVVLLAALSLAAGIFVNYPNRLVQMVVR